jgi:hypothetical protein
MEQHRLRDEPERARPPRRDHQERQRRMQQCLEGGHAIGACTIDRHGDDGVALRPDDHRTPRPQLGEASLHPDIIRVPENAGTHVRVSVFHSLML